MLERRSGVLQVVDLEETDAAFAVAFVNDSGVGAGGKRGDDGGLEIVRGRERRFLNLDFGAFPRFALSPGPDGQRRLPARFRWRRSRAIYL